MPARPLRGAGRSLAAFVPAVALVATAFVATPASAATAPAPTAASDAAATVPVVGSSVATTPTTTATTSRTVRLVGSPSAASATPPRPKVVAVKPAAAVSAAARVLRVAASLAGRPYRYGAVGPGSFDCSGYTRYVFAHAVGRSLPHSSSQQYSVVHHVARSAIRPGDLIFFTSGGHIYHVAIYAGRGLIWHAPHTGDHVRLAGFTSSSWVAGRVL
jgi:cell wall-associated NlpC family hydrolase